MSQRKWKHLHLWDRMNPFSVIKVVRKKRSKSGGNIGYLFWLPRKWAMKLVTGTARLHVELCPYHGVNCQSRISSHGFTPCSWWYVILSVSSEELRDCRQIWFGHVRWNGDKYWITEWTKIGKNPKTKTKTLGVLLWEWKLGLSISKSIILWSIGKKTTEWN